VLPWFYATVANQARALAREGAAGRAEAERSVGEVWAALPEDPERLLLERELHRAIERATAWASCAIKRSSSSSCGSRMRGSAG
jgi:hypothetical protein